MFQFNHLMLICALVMWLMNGCNQSPNPVNPSTTVPKLATTTTPVNEETNTLVSKAREINWDALVPADWRPDTIIQQAEGLSDNDPRAKELLQEFMELSKKAPVVSELDGKLIKLPGFVVPLEMDANTISQFLLVPYFGACIHVPPPPANQIVHVITKANQKYRIKLFDIVWIIGKIQVKRLSSDLGNAGYRVENAIVLPYIPPKT